MSGTSFDGADAILADFSAARPRVLAFASEHYPAVLRAELLALNSAGENEIARVFAPQTRSASAAQGALVIRENSADDFGILNWPTSAV